MTQTHAMPEELRRVQPGRYETRDGRWRIVQLKDGKQEGRWSVERRPESGEPVATQQPDGSIEGSPFKNRGEAVQVLRDRKLFGEPLPEPAKPAKPAKASKAEKPEKGEEQPQPEEQPDPKVTKSTQGIGGRNGHSDAKAPRRPRARKPAKAAATA
jgi:hypothetical protein